MKHLGTLFCCILFFASGAGSQTTIVQYRSGPKMNNNRMGHYSMVLPGGNVALVGGHGSGFVSLNTVDIYNPTSNTCTLDTMQYIHDFCAVSDLSDGTWLIAGGSNNLGVAPGISGAEIYNPATGKFTACSSLVYPRCVSTGVRLANNNVLIVGGWYDQTSATYGEIFNSSTKSFSATQALNTPRSNAVAIATNDSGAVIFGGYYYYGGTFYENVEYYNSKTNSFTQLQNHLFPNDSGWCVQEDMFLRPMSSQRMKNGKYLICAWKQSPLQYILGTFDPSTKSFAELNLQTSLPPADSVQFFKSPIVDTTRNVAYWYSMKPNSNPAIMQLYIIDLTTLTWQASQLYTTDYYWSYAGMNLLTNGNILISGGTTTNDATENFNPVDSTIIVSIGIATGVIGNGSSKNQPREFSLYQNYPNPFNPSTRIRFDLKEASTVTLDIFNVLGQRVRELNYGTMAAGEYERNIDFSGYASGVYFYRIVAAGNDGQKFVSVKKLLLMK